MKKNIGADLKTLLTESYLEDMAESHIECWKDRYFRKTKADVKFDLSVNHDDSLEVEMVNKDLGREMTGHESDYLVNLFHKKVVSIFNK